MLPIDLRNENEVDVLRSFILALLDKLGSQCTMEPLFFLPWPLQKNRSKALTLQNLHNVKLYCSEQNWMIYIDSK